MRRKLSLLILLLLGAYLGNLVWSRWGRLGAAEAPLQGRFATEEQWIVAEIAQDVAEMAFYASAKRPPGGALAFSIRGRSAPRGGSTRPSCRRSTSGLPAPTRPWRGLC